MHLEAYDRREERTQQTMRAHAYLVSGLVWAFASPEASRTIPSFEEFVFGAKPPADPVAATALSMAAWDAYLSRVKGRPS